MLDMDLKSLIKPRKARSPKRPKARKPQSSKARVLTSKPDPKAQEPSPACPNTKIDAMNAMNQQQEEPLMLPLPSVSFDPRARNWRTTFTTQDDDDG